MAATKRRKKVSGRKIVAPFVDGKKALSNLDVSNVEFQNASLRGGPMPDDIRKVSNVLLASSRVARSAAQNLALSNVCVDGCRTKTPIRLVNCFFDCVVMRGDVGSWHVSLDLFMPSLRTYSSEFYEDVEWALDIREARFLDAIFRGIPVDKVRRDPERHFIVRKDKLRRDDSWRRLPKPLVNRLAFWLRLDGDAELLIANDRAPSFEAELERYRALREAGFAE